MEGAVETLTGSAAISREDSGVKGDFSDDCNEISNVPVDIGTSMPAKSDFADDVIIASKPLKDGMLVENVSKKFGFKKNVSGMVADSMDNLEAVPETTDDG